MNRKFALVVALVAASLMAYKVYAQVIPTNSTSVASTSYDVNGVTHYSTQTVTIVNASSISSQLIPANPQRIYLRVINNSATTAYAGFSAACTNGTAYQTYQDSLSASGGSITYPNLGVDGTTPTGPLYLYFIATPSVKSVQIIEGSK